MAKVAIVGIGYSGFRPISPDLSYKELMFEAALRAYNDCGIDPRQDVDGFVTVAEDFHEGTSIFDEYVPDQLGAALRPVHTIAGEGIQGLAAGAMQILTGAMKVIVVEGHSKASNILTFDQISAYALDPIYNRPLMAHPLFIAGMEMRRFLQESGNTAQQCAMVVAKNKANALSTPYAGHGAKITAEDVLNSGMVAEPLTQLDIASHSDGAIVMVLAGEEVAQSLTKTPVLIRGMGWANGSYALENRDWARAEYATNAGEMAYRMAEIKNPAKEIDFAEVDDTFSYKELQHLEALSLFSPGKAGTMTAAGATRLDGTFPINPSGGSLGVGHLLEASGLQRVLEVVLQLRGEAEARQLTKAQTGLAFGWRGLPTTSGAAVILGREG